MHNCPLSLLWKRSTVTEVASVRDECAHHKEGRNTRAEVKKKSSHRVLLDRRLITQPNRGIAARLRYTMYAGSLIIFLLPGRPETRVSVEPRGLEIALHHFTRMLWPAKIPPGTQRVVLLVFGIGLTPH